MFYGTPWWIVVTVWRSFASLFYRSFFHLVAHRPVVFLSIKPFEFFFFFFIFDPRDILTVKNFFCITIKTLHLHTLYSCWYFCSYLFRWFGNKRVAVLDGKVSPGLARKETKLRVLWLTSRVRNASQRMCHLHPL